MRLGGQPNCVRARSPRPRPCRFMEMIPHAQEYLCGPRSGTPLVFAVLGGALVAAAWWAAAALGAWWPFVAAVCVAAALGFVNQLLFPLVLGPMLRSKLEHWPRMHAIERHYCKAVDAGRARFLVAHDAGDCVAGCALVLLGSEADIAAGGDGSSAGEPEAPENRHIARSSTATVSKVSVDARKRGLRIGAKLMAAAEACARSWGCARVELTTANQHAVEFYLRLGYTVSHHKRLLPWTTFRSVTMTKSLSKDAH